MTAAAMSSARPSRPLGLGASFGGDGPFDVGPVLVLAAVEEHLLQGRREDGTGLTQWVDGEPVAFESFDC